MLYYTYSMMQFPIVMLIIANISRLMGYFEGFFPLLRAMQRSVEPVLLLAVVMMLCCVGCGFALHLIVGDRVKTYQTMLSSIEFMGEFQLGEMIGITHTVLFGKEKGVLLGPGEYASIVFIYIFFPFITLFVIIQFVVAIFTDLFSEERERRRQSDKLKELSASKGRSRAIELMRSGSLFARLRTHVSAVLYTFGWRNLSAYVLSLNPKFLDGSPDAPTGFRTWKAASNLTPADNFRAQSPAGERFLGSVVKIHERLDNFLSHPLDSSLPPDVEEGSSTSESDESGLAFSPDEIAGKEVDYDSSGGLKSDSARWLRMNQRDRWELQSPTMGNMAHVALSQIFYTLQEYCHNDALKDETVNGNGGKNANAEIIQMQKAMRIENLAELSARLELSVLDIMLFEHLDQPDEAALVSSVRLSPKARKILGKKACLRMAREVVKDFGHPPGAEIDRSTGLDLVNVVLMRARDNARGLCSLSRDAISANMEFDDIARHYIDRVPRWTVPNSGRPRKRLTLGRLVQLGLEKASSPIWRGIGYTMRQIIGCIAVSDPTGGANELINMLGKQPLTRVRAANVGKFTGAQEMKQSQTVTLHELYASLGLEEDSLEEEFVEFHDWPAAVGALMENDSSQAALTPNDSTLALFSQ